MKVREIMSDDVRIASPDDSIARAAQMMEEIDAGFLPVGENDRLVGTITDRDIAIRAVGKNLDPQKTRVRDIMTAEVKYCYEDEELDEIAQNMGDQQVRRLPVVNRQKRLIGIISVGDIATGHKPVKAGVALRGIAEPSSQHNQSAAHAGQKPGRRS
jgi:CBS domain-containing protein